MKGFLTLAGIRIWLAISAVLLFSNAWAQTTWSHPFESGTVARFKITENGIYVIDADLLRKAGVDPSAINPKNIHLYSAPTGMLPQPNTAWRGGLTDIAIMVVGESDGKFDSGDKIVFYGEGPDLVTFDDKRQLFKYENNIYSEENYYFLKVESTPGVRVPVVPGASKSSTVVNQYQDFAYFESDLFNDLKSGRSWYGEQFDTKTEITIRFEMPGVVANSTGKVVTGLMAQSYVPSSFRVFWNTNQILDKQMPLILEAQYADKGATSLDTMSVVVNTVGAPAATNQDLRFVFTKGTQKRSVGYLDYLQLNVVRSLQMYKNQNLYTIPKQSVVDFDVEISAMVTGAKVWNITDPLSPKEIDQQISNSKSRFGVTSNTSTRFAAFTIDDAKKPDFDGLVANQDLKSLATPSLLIITHPTFLSEATRLANHRKSKNGLSVAVVTTQQIFNEFSSGRQDITAMRNFIRSLYLRTPNKLSNVLLFGKGSYDYKSRVFNNTNFVPIYESRNSLSPLESYSSDDYYGFMEETEGEWKETSSEVHTLDIGVGRLPVSTVDEAISVVDKLINYDLNSSRQNAAQQRVLFVADDGDFNIHQDQADQMAESFETTYKNYLPRKIYLDAFEQQSVSAGQLSPKATEAVLEQIHRGYHIVNYTGHGTERIWAAERLLDQETPFKLRNTQTLPVFITATCEFGRHDDPLLTSTAEALLLKKKIGAIGLVTSARDVNSGTNIILNKAFYAAYFAPSDKLKDFGSIFKETKNKSIDGISNRNFSLLGDPSMILSTPLDQAVVKSIKTSSKSDTLKSLSKVVITGEIQRNGIVSADFDGRVEFELFDRRSQLKTLGDENSPYDYKEWDHTLHRGQGTVENGEFVVECMLPVGIASSIGTGKVFLYATDGKGREAVGSATNVKIGSIEPKPAADNTGPFIELFMSDTTFVNGGIVSKNTFLVGRLTDKNGINISGYDKGVIEATLDGKAIYNLNDYYRSLSDDFSKGTFSFALSDLEEGNHSIVVKAADTYGNISSSTIQFVVGEDGKLTIEDLYAYPNPFTISDKVTLEFKHNRSGEDLDVQLAIYNSMGQMADYRTFSVNSSAYKVTLFEWDGNSAAGTKMVSGLYFFKVIVRSLADGAKNAKIAKLILVN